MSSLALRRICDSKVILLNPEKQLILEETVEYEILTDDCQVIKCFFDGIQLEPNIQGFLTIRPGNWVANSELCFHLADQITSFPVRVQPRQHKLSDSLWIAMVSDLENWLPGISAGIEGGKSGHVGKEGVPLPFIIEALTPLVKVFEVALRLLLKQPKQRDISVQEDMPLHMVRKVDRETLHWITRHPSLNDYLDPWKCLELQDSSPLIPQRLSIETNNHPANRYISWLVCRVESRLRSAAVDLEMIANSNSSYESLLWCRSRVNRLREGANSIQRLWRSSFLSEVQREPLSEEALQVVYDDPTYLRLHQIGRLFLNPLFLYDLRKGEYQTAVRPSYSVYELWAFLAVYKQMKESLPGWTWQSCKLSNLLNSCASGEGAMFRARNVSDDVVEIRFNSTFTSYFSHSKNTRWSISGERRPDIVITHKPHNGDGRWLCLDAKYRVGRVNLADAFSSVHIYRDALRYDGFGGKCQAVLLLCPSMTQDTEGWFSEAFIQQYGSGIWELKPGSHNPKLGTWINMVLGIEVGGL